MTTAAPRKLAGVLAVVLALFGLTAVPAQAASTAEKTPGGLLLFTAGHIDAFNVHGTSDPVLDLKEDITGLGVHHRPEDVILGVTDAAWEERTAGVPAIGTAGYYLPLTQNHSVIWPGWDSLDAQPFSTVRYNLRSVEGPGQIFMWTAGPFGGGFIPRLTSGAMTIASGNSIEQTFAAHEHINWLFTTPGVYTMTIDATVTRDDGTVETTAPATYTWAVGNAAVDSARAGALDPTIEVTPAPVTFDDDALSYTLPQTAGISYTVSGEPVVAGTYTVEPGQTVEVSAAPQAGYSFPAGSTASWTHTFPAPVQPEVTTPAAVSFDDEGLTFTVPSVDGVTYTLDTGETLSPGVHTAEAGATVSITALATDGYVLDPNVPASWNHLFPDIAPAPSDEPTVEPADEPTTDPTVEPTDEPSPDPIEEPAPTNPQCIPTKVKVPLAPVTVTKVGDSYTVPANTHAHPNWVFTKPGTYKVRLTHTATINGRQLTGTDVLTFKIGGSGNANDGHFDVGTAVDNGKLSIMIKDDRTARPTWKKPSEVVFGLSSAAKMTAPAGLEFLTPAGSEVYLIGSSQVAGVPWVGANTQHPSLGGSTPVTWTLTSVEGPGTMAVFSSGTFGGIGETWFGGTTTTTPYRIDYVGKTPDGKECDLDGGQVGDDDGQVVTPGPVTPTSPSETTGPNKPGPASPIIGGTNQPTPAGSTPPAKAPYAPAAPQCLPTEVEVPVTSAPGTKLGGSYTVPANTHAHPNWVFTKPGTYKVGLTQTATVNGQKLSASGVLTFNVGGAGNASDGHFDVGTAYENGQLSVMIKDDRTVPATWKKPSEVIFGLGSASQATAPAGMEFLAPAGSPIWMVSGSQVAGVPWVGANTQHPSLGGATPVTWTLTSVSGPGSMAVFGSGSFGGGIGQVWFGGAQQGETTTDVQYVGRTADGQPCDLDAADVAELQAQGKTVLDADGKPLANTGASLIMLTLLSFALLGLGITLKRRVA